MHIHSVSIWIQDGGAQRRTTAGRRAFCWLHRARKGANWSRVHNDKLNAAFFRTEKDSDYECRIMTLADSFSRLVSDDDLCQDSS